jgi:hypothetical protein
MAAGVVLGVGVALALRGERGDVRRAAIVARPALELRSREHFA